MFLEGDIPNQSNPNVDTLNVIQKAFGVRSSFSLREMMRRASAAVRSSELYILIYKALCNKVNNLQFQ